MASVKRAFVGSGYVERLGRCPAQAWIGVLACIRSPSEVLVVYCVASERDLDVAFHVGI